MAAPTPDEFRRAMARVPTPVTVVTAPARRPNPASQGASQAAAGSLGEGADATPGGSAPAGATANAVASLSLEPPLMLVCLDRRSRTLQAVRERGLFAVNVLGAGSEEHAHRFASTAPHAEKWKGVAWSERDGVPVLDEAIVWIVCELRDLLDGGDHVIVTGHVRDLGTREGDALAFHAGGYRSIP